MTARDVGLKQPFIQRVRNSSLVEGPGMIQPGIRQTPKARDSNFKKVSVGEHTTASNGVRKLSWSGE